MGRKVQNSLGMFNLFKGVAIIMVVFWHISSMYEMDSHTVFTSVLNLFNSLMGLGMMSAFLMIGGHGFRKRPVKKMILLQLKESGKPFLYTGIAAAILNMIIHYACFRWMPGAVKEAGRVIGGFLLGLPQTRILFGTHIYWCGPMWYVLAGLVGFCILNIIMNYVPEKLVPYAVVVVTIAGWILGKFDIWYFCLPQGLVACGYTYVGYRLKKAKFFQKRLSVPFLIVLLASYLVMFLTDERGQMVYFDYKTGYLGLVVTCVIGIFSCYVFTWLNTFENKLINLLCMVGRNSLYVLMAHNIEMRSVPWYLFKERLGMDPFLTFWIQVVLEGFVILLICMIMSAGKKWILKLRGKHS